MGYSNFYYLHSWDLPEDESAAPSFTWRYSPGIASGVIETWMNDALTNGTAGIVMARVFYDDGSSYSNETPIGPLAISWTETTYGSAFVTADWTIEATSYRNWDITWRTGVTEQDALKEKYGGLFTGFSLDFIDHTTHDGTELTGYEETPTPREDLGSEITSIRYLLETKISEMAELLVESTTSTKLMFKQIEEPTFEPQDISNLSIGFTSAPVPVLLEEEEEDEDILLYE